MREFCLPLRQSRVILCGEYDLYLMNWSDAMKFKAIATTALVASVSFAPVNPLVRAAHADGRDVVAGMIIGGIIGSAITNENNKKKSTKSSKAKVKAKPSMSAEQREANKEVQVALNYFGYPVGTPDGSIGPKSRAAISEYQAFLGYPATGQLTEYERTILVTSYHRTVAGGPATAGVVAGSVYGLKAMLIAQRDEMAGVAPGGVLAVAPSGVAAPGTVAAAAAAAIPTLLPEPVVEEVAVVAEPAPVVEEVAVAEDPALPSFMSPAGANGSLAAECNKVSLMTNTNGGMTTADGMQDANFALAEQFCLARTYAMAKGDELAQNVAGFTPDQIAEQCAAFGPVLKDHVAAVSLKPAEDVLAGVEGFILSSGMSPAQLSGTAKVCLGVGYTRDDMDVAMGSALLLAAMGEKGYGEFLGHHLSQGYGATVRPDLAMGWYEMSLDAMGQGQMVVAPGMEGRDAVIRKAAFTINGRAAELEPAAKIEEAALPVFEVTPEAEVVIEEAAVEVAPVVEPAAVAVAEPEVAPVAEEVATDQPALGTPAPVFVAPKLADVVVATPAPVPAMEPVPELAADVGANSEMVNAGAQAAMMAARLPFLIFSAF
jgi:peptidoglycan hydrolase-like protein with peptidoglycan-binding domain